MVLLFLYISAIYLENSVGGMKIFQEGWYSKKGELTNKGVASHFPTMQ